MDGTQQKIVKMRNELKAQKVYSGLTYSSLLLPENTPTQSYSDTINLSGSGNSPLARIRFRFIRTDGIIEPPMVNFTLSATINPTYANYARANGFTINGNDLSFFLVDEPSGYIAELGDGYVDFYVDFGPGLRDEYYIYLNTINISVTVQAIANVSGILTVERII